MSKNAHRDRVLAPPSAAPEPAQQAPQAAWTREAYAAALRGRRVLTDRIDNES
jgi:hypothetical protein